MNRARTVAAGLLGLGVGALSAAIVAAGMAEVLAVAGGFFFGFTAWVPLSSAWTPLVSACVAALVAALLLFGWLVSAASRLWFWVGYVIAILAMTTISAVVGQSANQPSNVDAPVWVAAQLARSPLTFGLVILAIAAVTVLRRPATPVQPSRDPE